MIIEVERKSRVDSASELQKSLVEIAGVVWGAPQRQLDRYFAHPARDFAKSDEALRLRRDEDAARLTYKGPRRTTEDVKSRREIEIVLAEGAVAGVQEAESTWTELLEALGFHVFAEVRKTRRTGQARWRDRELTIALDDVDGLGQFVELEIRASPAHVAAAQAAIEEAATTWRLGPLVRETYLEMLLAAGGAPR